MEIVAKSSRIFSVRRALLVIALGLLGGCKDKLFDPDLLNGAAGFPLAETCSGDVPMLLGNMEGSIDLRDFANDVSQTASCTGATTPGPDGFFAVPMEAGDKWHFHLTVTDPTLNPALYVLDSCDARRCQPGDGIDVCDGGNDEHLSFVAPRDGTYFVGIDTQTATGGQYRLLALQPTCGDGVLEHSEGCDDGNDVDGDGCDATCRHEIAVGSPAEQEPNDDYTGANALVFNNAPVEIDGVVQSRCDVDLYSIDAQPGQRLQVQMYGEGMRPCDASVTPPFELKLLDDRAVATRAIGSISDENACPMLEAELTTGGRYHITISSDEDVHVFPYVLIVSLTDP